ncbi:unnamed protein product [Ilex paraguariensis]|uniref:Uncharacterized protein n=1 Tax=Ilex paraguariensis TaxID=185542 RepID=A0ABC8V110_9AQUA
MRIIIQNRSFDPLESTFSLHYLKQKIDLFELANLLDCLKKQLDFPGLSPLEHCLKRQLDLLRLVVLVLVHSLQQQLDTLLVHYWNQTVSSTVLALSSMVKMEVATLVASDDAFDSGATLVVRRTVRPAGFTE